ncbi:hypothetical protein BGW36DRAFT_169894 [Talaromyces proteolyticus]|uniref:Centrosomin N-terminal motif 1 domain-containing protein n=1 Tax=Talaromyces proteolyticus TaxID=1131652 RepID=A0AAD4KRD1_9EURO|nr:uncharacterized protein BGW36DRAFT_169894 [Talaromyces proteolyticus]KAH8697595.1 hypothetical protein BGW36DRAFT_169894 [Talaromyces proteolyticus]
MSVYDQRRPASTGPSSSPLPQSPFLRRTGGVSPTRRTSSRRLSSHAGDAGRALARSTPRKISRNNPPHINNDIAKSQFSIMNPRPQTPTRRDSDTAVTLVNPTSTILQGLIKEQRASRSSRRATPDMPDTIAINTTPTSQSHSRSHEDSVSEKQRRVSNSLSAGIRQPRDMGVREMDQYVSKINKLNFDLKLEIFHRTQQMAALEKKLERMRAMEQELERLHGLEDELDELREVDETNERLREANEQLQSELDKRDQAISEAVDMICQLEAKVEELQAGRSEPRPSTATPPANEGLGLSTPEPTEVCTPKADIVVDIPDRTSSRKGTRRRPRKAPSFLREENRSTAALRSLYLTEENKSVRSVSTSTMATTVDSTMEPSSPRLSVLSECSYFNPQDIQPNNNAMDQLDRLDRYDFTAEDHPDMLNLGGSRDSHIGRMDSNWTQPQSIVNGSLRRNRARTLSDVSRGTQVPATSLVEPFLAVRDTKTFHLDSPSQPHLSFFGGRLPPTPDTMSTFRLGAGSGSNASFSMDRAAVDYKAPGTPSSMPRHLSRPRSAGQIATRPSTGISGVSDGIDTTMSVDTQQELAPGSRYDIPGLFHSFNHFGRGSSKATQLLGPGSPSNPRLSCYGGDLLFNGEGVDDIVSGIREGRTSSFRSDVSSKFPTRLASSPPLSPQEWLEAAKSEESAQEIRSSPSSLSEGNLVIETSGAEQPDVIHENKNSADSQPLPRNPPLRLRAWANDTQAVPEPQPRRRLSLRPRFFSRNRQQEPPSVSTDSNQGPSPLPTKSPLLNVSKHRRTGSGPGLVSEGCARPGTTEAIRIDTRPLPRPLADLRPSTTTRPKTSDSSEHRRKGSLLLGWMKGSTNKDADCSLVGNLSLPRSATERPKSTVSTGSQTFELWGANEDSSKADDEPVWRARRRSRRLA